MHVRYTSCSSTSCIFSRSKDRRAPDVKGFFTVTLEVDVTFRVILDWDDACKRSCLPDLHRSPDVFHLPAKKNHRMWTGEVV
jgi:hypothetical protein